MRRVIFILITLFTSLSAHALIKAPLDLFAASSGVLRMKVAAVNPENKGIELTLTEVALGKYDGNTAKLQLSRPDGLFDKVKKDDPAIVFINRRGANDVIHIADTWVIVSLNETKTAWIGQTERKEFYTPFPGTTTSLDQRVINRKENKDSMLEELEEKQIFAGKSINLGHAPTGATSVYTLGHFFFFNTPDGIRVLKLVKSRFEKTDLKIEGTAQGAFFQTLITTEGAWQIKENIPQKVESDSLTSDKSAAVNTLLKTPSATGLYLSSDNPAILEFEKSGPLLRLVKSPEHKIDFQRLTGRKWSDIAPENFDATSVITKTLDINNDKLDDVLILWKEGGVLLVNRGYNCFFASETAVHILKDSAHEYGLSIINGQITPFESGLILYDKDDLLLFEYQK